MGSIATALTGVKGPLMFYSQGVLKDVPAEKFASKPRTADGVIDTNHPAFLFGHMSIYPKRILEMVGAPASGLEHPEGFEDLFAAGKECRDDPDCSIYPSMEAITSYYFTAHEALFSGLAELSDEHLAAPHGIESEFASNFGSRAAIAAFMCGPHPFSHIGQMSVWRRCMGLGPAF